MKTLEMKIIYKEHICEGCSVKHSIITDCTNVNPLIKLLQKNGYEIVGLEQRKIDNDIWDYLCEKWEDACKQ